MTFAVDLEALHGEELPERHGGGVVLGVTADARDLEGDVEVLTVVRADSTVQRGEAEAGREDGGNDAVQLVLTGDAGTEGQGLEDVEGVLVEGRDART
jgi:hypothetical protein